MASDTFYEGDIKAAANKLVDSYHLKVSHVAATMLTTQSTNGFA